MQSVDENKAVGTISNTEMARLDVNGLNVLKTSVDASDNNIAFDDEWSSLENDLKRVLNMNEPLAQSTVFSNTTLSNSSPAKILSKNVTSSAAGMSLRGSNSCQFCAKNGETREFVWILSIQIYFVQSIIMLFII